MISPRGVLMRLRALLRPGAVASEVEDEFRFHLELEIEQNLRAGMSAEEARRHALLAFGGVDRHREAVRDGSGARWLDDLRGDTRLALRGLRRAPGFTAVAVLTLAIGIGATTAIFSAVHAVLLRPLPYAEADELLIVFARNPERSFTHSNISYVDYQDWKHGTSSFEQLGLFQWGYHTFSQGEGAAERVAAAEVTANLFPLLGVEPMLGRGFREEEEVVGRHRIVIIGHGVWQRRFGGDRSILGRTVSVDGRPHTVIGVMPPGFRFPYSGESWTPLAREDYYRDRSNRDIAGAVGRLADGVTVERAEAELTALSRRLAQQYPETNRGWEAEPLPLREHLFGELRPALVLLFAAVGLVLLVICANLANLLLARGAARGRELALRAALGAGRSRLMRQLLTEGFVLAVLGGAAGILVAVWAMRALRISLTDRLPAFVEIRADPIVYAFAFGITAAVAVLFGFLPALRATRIDAHAELKEGGRATGGPGSARLRSSLIVAEVALAVVLLVGSTLLIRTMDALQGIRPGFDATGILTARYHLPHEEYETPDERRIFLDQLLERLRTLPGVRDAAAAQGTPFSGWNVHNSYSVEGEPAPLPGQGLITHVQSVTPEFFRVLAVPIVRGRGLLPTDTANSVAVVNERFARRHFANTEPIGRRFRFGGDDSTWKTIVGVVADYRHFELTEPMRPAAYLPFAADPGSHMRVVIKAAGAPEDLVPSLRAALGELDPDVPAFSIETLEDVIARQTWVQRIARDILTAFAATAALLVVIGLYGVISYAVTRRRHELGIRLALGATPRRVRRLVVRQGLVLGLAGIALGWVASFAAVRLLTALLFDVEPVDTATFIAVPLVVAGLAVLASWVPARRAAALDPVMALRAE